MALQLVQIPYPIHNPVSSMIIIHLLNFELGQEIDKSKNAATVLLTVIMSRCNE